MSDTSVVPGRLTNYITDCVSVRFGVRLLVRMQPRLARSNRASAKIGVRDPGKVACSLDQVNLHFTYLGTLLS